MVIKKNESYKNMTSSIPMQRASSASGDSIRFVVDAQTRVRASLCGCVEGNPDGISSSCTYEWKTCLWIPVW